MSNGRVVLVLILICTGIVCTSVTADPYSVSINTQKRWIVANGTDVTKITLDIKNASSFDPINEGYVGFTVNETYYGEFNASTFMIVNGSVSVDFRPLYKSGTASITATIMNGTDFIQNVSFDQLIDHDRPFKIPAGGKILPWNGEERVGNVTLIGLYMEDTHRNPIDNRRELDEGREAEKVKFMVIGTPGYPDTTAYFLPGNVTNITVQVNGTGWATTPLRMDIRPGANIIKAYPLTTVPDPDPWTIVGVADGMPCSISSRISTSDGYERNYTWADGIQKFYILYQINDEYGNGVQLKSVNISTDISELSTVITNATGAIGINYGPKSDIGEVSITARTVQNSSVYITDIVRFVNLTANDLIFTATPQSMASYDAKPALSTLNGLIIDSEGNPVMGQQVKFTLTDILYEETYNVTEQPSLQNGTVSGVNVTWSTTDEFGIAKVYLKPCSFTYDENAAGFDPSATGHCTVNAEWDGPNGTVRRPLTFTFKNYPYLSVATSVSSSKVNVSGTVDVTVWLKGDGFQLAPKPVDAILVFDRSGSMQRYKDFPTDTGQLDYRIVTARKSSKSFVDQMDASNGDRIGLVSYSYEDNVALNAQLGTNFSTIKTRIDGLTGNGGTAMREGIRRAIVEMNTRRNTDPRAIHAIIVMTDGNWNNGGNPLAIGKGYGYSTWVTNNRAHHTTGQNGFSSLATEFEEEDYRWYTGLGGNNIVHSGTTQVVVRPRGIDELTGLQTYPASYEPYSGVTYCSNGQFTNQNMSIYANTSGIKIYAISFASNIPQSERDALTVLAESTGGFYRHAPTAQDLTDIYGIIGGDLRKHAGVNTTSNVSFENVTVKNVTVPGSETFNYNYLNGISTFIERWKIGNSSSYQSSTRNDTVNWTTNHTLNFNVGTMEVNDNWRMTFRLQVLKEGDIHVFDPTSVITFDDGTKSLHIPDTVTNAIANLTNESFQYGEFHEEDINVTQISPTTYEWEWTRIYTGSQPVQEYYFVSLDGGYQWTLVGEKTLSAAEAGSQSTGSFIYDIQNLLPHGADASGVILDFRIKAYAIDAASPRTPRGPQIVRLPQNVTYITLE